MRLYLGQSVGRTQSALKIIPRPRTRALTYPRAQGKHRTRHLCLVLSWGVLFLIDKSSKIFGMTCLTLIIWGGNGYGKSARTQQCICLLQHQGDKGKRGGKTVFMFFDQMGWKIYIPAHWSHNHIDRRDTFSCLRIQKIKYVNELKICICSTTKNVQ